MTTHDPHHVSEPPPDHPAAAPQRRKGRWFKRFVVLLILLGLIVGLLPYAAGTSPGRQLISKLVSQRIAGQVDIGSLALSWMGPCRAGNLTVNDAAGREVLTVGSAEVEHGVLRLISTRGQLEGLKTAAVRAQLLISQDNQISLVSAFDAPGSAAPAEGEPREILDASIEQLQGSYGNGRLEVDAPAVQLTPRKQLAGGPLALSIKGHLESGRRGLDAHLVLGGDLGTADATIAYDSGTANPVSTAKLLNALLTGGTVQLPGITVQSDAMIDIARLAGLAPGLLRVREDTTLTGGQLKIEKLDVKGGTAPTLSGRLTLSGLAAMSGGERISIEPIQVTLDAVYEADQGMVLRKSGIESSYATIDASGTASNLKADFKIDLSRLHAQFNRLFDLQDIDAQGQVDGQVAVTRLSEERIGVQLDARSSNLLVAVGGRRVVCRQAAVQHTGELSLEEQTIGRVSSKSLRIRIDDQIDISGAGWVDLRSRGFEAQVNAKDLDLADLSRRLKEVGVDALEGLAGKVSLEAGGHRPGASGPIQTSGTLDAANLSRDGKILGGAAMRCAWTGGRLDPATSEFAIAKLTLDGAEVKADLQLAYTPAPASTASNDASLSTAVLAGRLPPLPNINAQGQATLNLPLLMAAVRPFLKNKPEMDINNGVLKLTGLQIQTLGRPSFKGVADLSNVVIARSGKVQPWPAMSVDMDLELKPGVGLEARRVQIKSSVLDLDGSGSPAGAKATLRADLAPLRQLLESVVEIPLDVLAGNPDVNLQLSRVGDDRLDYSVDVKTGPFRVRQGDHDVRLTAGTVSAGGSLTLKNDRPQRLSWKTLKADLDNQMNFTGSGWYDFGDGTFDADVNLPQAELAYLGGKAAELGIKNLKSLGGTMAVQGKVGRTQAGAAMVSTGDARIRRFAQGGELLSNQEVIVRWNDLRYNPSSDDLQIPSAEVKSDLLDVQIKQATMQGGAALALSGDLSGRADLGRCLKLVGQLQDGEPPAAMAGMMNFDTRCSLKSGVTTVSGKARVDQWVWGSGPDAISEPQVTLDYRGRIDPRPDVMTIEQFAFKSQTLSLELSGDIRDFSKSKIMGLSGKYEGSCDRLSAMLHRYAPSTVEIVTLTGPTADTIRIAGPMYGPDGKFNISGLQGGFALHWKTGDLLALPLSAAALPASLHDGTLHVPWREIPTAGGKVRLGGRIDFRGETAMLHVPGKVQILEEINIDQDLAKSLLSRMNPIFMHLAAIDGKVSLRGEDVVLPLGSAIKKGGSGRGYLDWSRMNVRPGGLLSEVLRLCGLSDAKMYALRGSGLDFQIRNGRLHYKDFVMKFADEFDLRFYGSVGFDDTLDLIVSVPVNKALLDQLRVPGVGGLLANARVDIPVVGTRERPRLDLSKADLTKIFSPGRDLLGDLEKLFPPSRPKDKKKP